jgi:hypothetical protein
MNINSGAVGKQDFHIGTTFLPTARNAKEGQKLLRALTKLGRNIGYLEASHISLPRSLKG